MGGKLSASLRFGRVATWLLLASGGAFADAAPDELAYAQYNNAVASIADGRVAEGIALLEDLSGRKTADPASNALYDQASVALCYYFLRNHQAGEAIPVFSRVRSPGPYSSRALLGLGWARAAPAGVGRNRSVVAVDTQAAPMTIGSLLKPRLTADIAALRRRMPFHVTAGTVDEQLALRRALVPWTELTGRDPLDPAVQEGMLAIPYALDHLGAHEEAREFYERAAKSLRWTQDRIDEALKRIGDGRMAARIAGNVRSDPDWWLADLPTARWWIDDALPETFYFEYLIADGEFRDAAAAYRQALRDGGESNAQTQRARLEEVATGSLQRTRQRTERYLGLGLFALARMHDQPLEAAR